MYIYVRASAAVDKRNNQNVCAPDGGWQNVITLYEHRVRV